MRDKLQLARHLMALAQGNSNEHEKQRAVEKMLAVVKEEGFVLSEATPSGASGPGPSMSLTKSQAIDITYALMTDERLSGLERQALTVFIKDWEELTMWLVKNRNAIRGAKIR